MTGEPLTVNLSLVGVKPTGLATYALNLIPQLPISDLLLLAPSTVSAFPTAPSYPIPNTLSAEQGKWGHMRRLLWTQWQLPRIYQQVRSRLLFSPVPEVPLNSICRSVVVVHDLIPLRFPRLTSPLTQYFRYYVPQVLNQAEHIICNSTATADDVCRVYGVSAQKMTPIPLAHDRHHFRVLPPEALLPPPRPYFFYVGRHDPYKNLQRVISALATLPRDCELWLAGSGDRRYTPLLQAQATELGLSDRVRFLDYVSYDQLPVLMNQAIALVFPSLWEGFGFPVLEAMACGTPVITSNLSSLPEVAGDAAMLVDPYNLDELAAAMRTVVMDGGVRSHLREAGLARANRFSWEKTGRETAAVLGQFL